jgi:outer membrane scaffolding protein for murein synthesis (MipA/OmpV family)
VSYTLPVTQQTRVVFGAGASFGDRTYLRARFGVPAVAGGAGPSRLPAYEPGGGLYSVDLGVDVMTALSRHWVVWGGVGASQVQGDARRSPLTVRPTSFSASLGLAYRCCR